MLSRLIQSRSLLLLREAFSSLLPIVLMMNIFVLVIGLPKLLEFWGIGGVAIFNGDEVSRLYFFLIPLFLNISLGLLIIKEKELDQIGSVLIAMVCYFRISGYLTLHPNAQLTSHNGSILISIAATFVAVNLLSYFSGFSQFRLIKYKTTLSPRLKKALNLLIPGFLTILCFEVTSQLIRIFLATGISSFLTHSLQNLNHLGNIQELILYKTIAQLAWLIGIHGEYSADGFFRLAKNIPAWEPSAIHLKTFHDAFMNIGGSGSTFIIPFLLLVTHQTKEFKSIAQLSLLFSLFNVNEILLFGLPIILNPVFLLPFVLVPLVNMGIALTAMHLGLFTIAPIAMHWMSPPLYGAYIATNGSLWGVFTCLLCIIVDGFIYLPFLRFAGQQARGSLYLDLAKEDAFSFLTEEISVLEERLFLTQQIGDLHRTTSTQKTLHQLRGGQFLLYFQPKIDTKSSALVGLEALIRFQNAAGDILPPTFLTVLYRLGLSKVVDKKVVSLVLAQVNHWRAQGLSVPRISINFDKDFLLDQWAVKDFIQKAQEHQVQFYLEITEHTYTVELQALASVICQLKSAGHYISIDDFGAGYSSLTTLVSLKADEIKLDRKLVAIPEEEAERGQILLASSAKLCRDLGFVVVAEGVETQSQLDLVQQCGIDIVQGYLTGKPMPPEQIALLLPTL